MCTRLYMAMLKGIQLRGPVVLMPALNYMGETGGGNSTTDSNLRCAFYTCVSSCPSMWHRATGS